MTGQTRYFELIDSAGELAVFWEVALDGPCIVSWTGPVGTPGASERELCASEAAAAHELALRIAERVGNGYRECADRRLDARTQALEAAIDADPADPTPYLIYADWIQTLGDPRGELIVAQHARGDEARAVLDKHPDVFLGPLALHGNALLRLRWFCGFIAAARVAADEYGHQGLELLIDHPSARWLRELAVDVPNAFDSLQRAVGVLAARPRPHLRALDIGNTGRAYSHYSSRGWGRVDLGPLWPRVPNLMRLVVRGDPGRLGTLALPQLQQLTLHCRDVVHSVARAIADAACPALRRLELRGAGGDLGPTLHAIAHGTIAPQLAELVVNGCPDGDAVCRVLAGANLPALRELQVTNCHVSRRGVEALAHATLALDILDLSYNLIPADVALDGLAKLVIADKQVRSRY